MTSKNHESVATLLITEIKEFISHATSLRRTYDCTQPEIYEKFLQDARAFVCVKHASLQYTSVNDVRAAINKTPVLKNDPLLKQNHYYFASTEPPHKDSHAFTDLTSLESGEHEYDEEKRRLACLVKEIERALSNVTKTLNKKILSGAYKQESNPFDDDWMVCVQSRYHVAAAKEIENQLYLTYNMEASKKKVNRPYLQHHTRYNLILPLAKDPKEVFCTVFFFRFLLKPKIPD